jgi:hypothetical protein
MKIASNDIVSNLINWYTVWKDAQNFEKNSNDPPMIVNDSSGYSCFHYKDIDSINQCKDSIVVIDCLTEGLHSKDSFEQYRKDHHYIIFSNGNWNIDRWDLKISYTLIWYPYFLFDMVDTYNTPTRFSYHLSKEYIYDYPKPLSFSCIIGNVRSERDLLVKKILSKFDSNRFILRYSGKDFGVSSDKFDLINFAPGEFDPFIKLSEKYYYIVMNTMPVKLYNQSYFNLIVETDVNFPDSFFLTEKTIKFLISGQPFVVVSNPDHLKNLKEIGFRTFDHLWDESYDSIQDFESRIDAIIKLCEYLSTDFDWQSNRNQLEEIKKHNRFVFQNLNVFVNHCFCNIEKKLQEFD